MNKPNRRDSGFRLYFLSSGCRGHESRSRDRMIDFSSLHIRSTEGRARRTAQRARAAGRPRAPRGSVVDDDVPLRQGGLSMHLCTSGSVRYRLIAAAHIAPSAGCGKARQGKARQGSYEIDWRCVSGVQAERCGRAGRYEFRPELLEPGRNGLPALLLNKCTHARCGRALKAAWTHSVRSVVPMGYHV